MSTPTDPPPLDPVTSNFLARVSAHLPDDHTQVGDYLSDPDLEELHRQARAAVASPWN